MSDIWFTSDLHFNHENILSFANKTRPWHTVKEMNAGLIEAWNSVVKRADIVYVIGDFILGKPDIDNIADICTNLNGWVNLIPGNHDTDAKLGLYRQYGMLTIMPPLVKLKDDKIVMCHFPLAIWQDNRKGSWMLHGHSHGSYKDGKGKIMDVGVDCHPEHRPFHYDEVAKYMKDRLLMEYHHD